MHITYYKYITQVTSEHRVLFHLGIHPCLICARTRMHVLLCTCLRVVLSTTCSYRASTNNNCRVLSCHGPSETLHVCVFDLI